MTELGRFTQILVIVYVFHTSQSDAMMVEAVAVQPRLLRNVQSSEETRCILRSPSPMEVIARRCPLTVGLEDGEVETDGTEGD